MKELASGPLGAAQRADREIARQTALRARAVAEFAATRPASADRQPGQPGCMSAERRASRADVLADVSEWATQEIVVAFSISMKAAEELLTRSLTLVHRLPKSLAALENGALHPGHLWPLLEKVAPIADPEVRARVESGLLSWAAGRTTTPAQLGAKARRMVLAIDARGAARRLTEALRRRGVSMRPDADGMVAVTALLTVPEGQAVMDALGRYADALDDDLPGLPPRTRDQKVTDCLLDLVLRPGETDLPPVQAQVTVVAGVPTMLGGDEPGEIGGDPVPAEMVRALARGLGLLPDVAPFNVAPSDAPASDGSEPLSDEAEEAALERWWQDVEERALLGEWGGAEEPPQDELERMWVRDGAWWRDPDDVGPPPGSGAPEPVPDNATALRGPAPWWGEADRAVQGAGATLLDLKLQMGRARRAVDAAEIRDAADEAAWQECGAGRLNSADSIAALAQATADQRAALGALLERTGGGGLVDRPRIAVVDALSGALLALTDGRELRAVGSCGRAACRSGVEVCTHDLSGRAGLGPPGPSITYRPGGALDRFLRARDRRCRFPGCRRRVPRGGELDHHEPWPDGATAAGNLTGFCTGHHRGKHQAPGWQYALSPDGTLTVTTPTGLSAATTPAPY